MDRWDTEFGAEGGLFRRLRDACAAEWEAYTWHPFVRAMSDGTLPLAAFRRYLVQDYLFLLHFARAEALAAALPGLEVVPWERRTEALGGCALLVNTTSQGMAGQDALDMDLDGAPPGLAVADIVYAPLVTPLLADAAARGLRCVGGLGMLLHQAAPGFERWFGVMPAVDEALHDVVTGAAPQVREEWGYGPGGR